MADNDDQDNQERQPPSSIAMLASLMSDSSNPYADVGTAFSALGPGRGQLVMAPSTNGTAPSVLYTPPGRVTPVNITENMKIGMDYLMSQGWTKEQASGILANGIAESGLNSAVIGDGGAARYTFQWHSDRRIPLERAYAANASGMNALPTDTAFMRDLKMMNYELRHGAERAHGLQLAKIHDAGQAGAYFSQYVERPLRVEHERNVRGAKAESVLKSWDTKMATQGARALPNQVSEVMHSGNIVLPKHPPHWPNHKKMSIETAQNLSPNDQRPAPRVRPVAASEEKSSHHDVAPQPAKTRTASAGTPVTPMTPRMAPGPKGPDFAGIASAPSPFNIGT